MPSTLALSPHRQEALLRYFSSWEIKSDRDPNLDTVGIRLVFLQSIRTEAAPCTVDLSATGMTYLGWNRGEDIPVHVASYSYNHLGPAHIGNALRAVGLCPTNPEMLEPLPGVPGVSVTSGSLSSDGILRLDANVRLPATLDYVSLDLGRERDFSVLGGWRMREIGVEQIENQEDRETVRRLEESQERVLHQLYPRLDDETRERMAALLELEVQRWRREDVARSFGLSNGSLPPTRAEELSQTQGTRDRFTPGRVIDLD